MSDELTMPEQLCDTAERLIVTFREHMNKELTFDGESVEWIDGYIERMRPHFPADKRSGLVTSLGAFVRECMIRNYGGQWMERDGSWGVQVSKRIWACPFSKIEKQFENGSVDSVASMFRCTPVLDKHLEEERTKETDER